MLRRALVMLRRALVMLRRAPPLETRMDKGFAGIEPPFTFLLPFFYPQRPVDNCSPSAEASTPDPLSASPGGWGRNPQRYRAAPCWALPGVGLRPPAPCGSCAPPAAVAAAPPC